MARKITVFPPIKRYCFGPPEPARSPRPAATRMAAVRSGFGMGLDTGVSEWTGGSIASLAHSPYHAGSRKAEQFTIVVHYGCGESIFCCSALARLPELSKV